MNQIRLHLATWCLLTATALAPAAERIAIDLDLGAMVQPPSMESRFSEEGYYVWCGSQIQTDDGKSYLLYSRWPKSKGFAGWVIHSEIAYATSDNPMGPFVPAGVVFPARGDDYAGIFTGQEGGLALFDSADGLHWQPSAQPDRAGEVFQIRRRLTQQFQVGASPALVRSGRIPESAYWRHVHPLTQTADRLLQHPHPLRKE